MDPASRRDRAHRPAAPHGRRRRPRDPSRCAGVRALRPLHRPVGGDQERVHGPLRAAAPHFRDDARERAGLGARPAARAGLRGLRALGIARALLRHRRRCLRLRARRWRAACRRLRRDGPRARRRGHGQPRALRLPPQPSQRGPARRGLHGDRRGARRTGPREPLRDGADRRARPRHRRPALGKRRPPRAAAAPPRTPRQDPRRCARPRRWRCNSPPARRSRVANRSSPGTCSCSTPTG